MDSCKSYLNKHFNATIQQNCLFTVQNEQSSLFEIKTILVRRFRNFGIRVVGKGSWEQREAGKSDMKIGKNEVGKFGLKFKNTTEVRK